MIGVYRHTIAGLYQIESIGKADIFWKETVEITVGPEHCLWRTMSILLSVCQWDEQPDVKWDAYFSSLKMSTWRTLNVDYVKNNIMQLHCVHFNHNLPKTCHAQTSEKRTWTGYSDGLERLSLTDTLPLNRVEARCNAIFLPPYK